MTDDHEFAEFEAPAERAEISDESPFIKLAAALNEKADVLSQSGDEEFLEGEAGARGA